MKPIADIARSAGIAENYLEPYGTYKAKISLDILKTKKENKKAKYVLVTAMTPTPKGEGKTVTAIGLSMAFNRTGKKSIVCLRQPSMGPLFGAKGGGSGSGRAQLLPAHEVNLHLTGDVHAVSIAHNLCAAFLDNAIYRNQLDIDRKKVFWRRVLDVNDRALRSIICGLDSFKNNRPRACGFDIAVASELMAIVALSENIFDVRKRIGRIVVAMTKKNRIVTTEDLGVAGAMTALLKDAIKPTLVQTSENTPAFVHAGPFANIAHGNNSIVADRIALRLADVVVTESGFGADCGAEKFFDIKCRVSGLRPDAAVLVCSLRAIKLHSGRYESCKGASLECALKKENRDALKEGCANLVKQIENIAAFGVPCVVAINKFSGDSPREIEMVARCVQQAGAVGAAVSQAWAHGGRGAVALAKLVDKAFGQKSNFRFLYPQTASIKEKIQIIATKIYGAKNVSYSPQARKQIALFAKLGYGALPVCMAKTQLSLSHDPKLKGRPRGFSLPVKDVRIAAGAGFISVLCGTIQTMPGLPSHPAGTKVDIDKEGKIVGIA